MEYRRIIPNTRDFAERYYLMKRIIAVLLLAVLVLSCVACQGTDGETTATTTENATEKYHPDPDKMALTEEELSQGYKLYQGIFYDQTSGEVGGYLLYDTDKDCVYELPQTISQPDDFFDGFSSGDTVKIKGYDRDGLRYYYINASQISLVTEGDVSNIPDDILEKFNNHKW